MAVGERVRVAREAAGISQKSLADKIGVSEYTIIRLEKGRRSAKSDELEKIATALDVPLSYLVGIDDGEAPMPSDVTPLTVPRGRMISVPLLSREVTALPMPAQARYVRSRKGGYKWIRGDRRRRRFPQNRRRRSRRRRFGVTSALTTAESR